MDHTVPIVTIPGGIRRALSAFDEDRLAWLDQANARGPLAGLKLGPVIAWVVSDSAEARRLLVEEADAWRRPSAITAPVRLAAGPNLFSDRQRSWGSVQRHIAPAFRRRGFEARAAELDALAAAHVNPLALGTPLNLRDLTQGVAFAATVWMLFGTRLVPTDTARLVPALQVVLDWIGDRIGMLSGFSLLARDQRAQVMRRQRAILVDFADQLIDAADPRGEGFDLLSSLASARRHGRRLDRRQLRGYVLGLLIAGTETTAGTLAWAIHSGAEHPAAWNQLCDASLSPRPYIDETLRLQPAAWGIPRTPAKSGRRLLHSNGHVTVRPGAVVNIYLRAIHRDPDVWERPDDFRPERHRHVDGEQARSLIPFGLGPRSCIGQAIALAELTTILPVIAARGRVTVEEDGEPVARFALTPPPTTTARFDARHGAADAAPVA